MFCSLCTTTSAISRDIGDAIVVPLICSYIWSFNWIYPVRYRFVHSIQLECWIFECSMWSSLLSHYSMVFFTSFNPMVVVYNVVTSKDTIISWLSISVSLTFSKNWVADWMQWSQDSVKCFSLLYSSLDELNVGVSGSDKIGRRGIFDLCVFGLT